MSFVPRFMVVEVTWPKRAVARFCSTRLFGNNVSMGNVDTNTGVCVSRSDSAAKKVMVLCSNLEPRIHTRAKNVSNCLFACVHGVCEPETSGSTHVSCDPPPVGPNEEHKGISLFGGDVLFECSVGVDESQVHFSISNVQIISRDFDFMEYSAFGISISVRDD